MIDFTNAILKIENTTFCGANCTMCPRDIFEHKHETMSVECFERIADQAANLGATSMIFGGLGDPLMDVHLEQRLEYVKSNHPNMSLSMINTGHLLSGKNVDIVCKYLDMIKISNYGFKKETYEKIHRRLDFDKIKHNIDEFLGRTSRPYTIMTFLLLQENKDEMKKWKEYYEPLCDRIDIWKPHNWGGETSSASDEISVECKRATTLKEPYFCSDGSVSVCCFDFNRKLVIGNIMREPLTEILNSDRASAIRLVHKNNQVDRCNLICKDCDQVRNRTDALVYTNSGNMVVGENSMQAF